MIFLHPFSPLYASGNKDSDKEVCKKGHLSFSLRSPAGPSDAHRKERVESNIVSIAEVPFPHIKFSEGILKIREAGKGKHELFTVFEKTNCYKKFL